MKKEAILVTGSTGFVGGVLAAALAASDERPILLPIRLKHAPEDARDAIAAELLAMGRDADAATLRRLVFIPLPRTAVLLERLVPELVPALADYEITDVVHCAGSLSYFNAAKLREGNFALTQAFLDVARAVGVKRFVYVSTAFASGYVDGTIAERLHSEPERDPNEYTRSKRETEALVAASGLPFLIVRPSIVVGHSASGSYQGRPYGAYQIWTGLSKFLCDHYRQVIHAVAPDIPLNFIHQDALQAGFLGAFYATEPSSIVHLVSRDQVTTRDYWQLWMDLCGKPEQVVYHDTLEALDRSALDEGQRLLIDFAEANIEISTHRWQFETTALDRMRAMGLPFVDASRQTLTACLERFLSASPKSLAFMARLAARGAADSIAL